MFPMVRRETNTMVFIFRPSIRNNTLDAEGWPEFNTVPDCPNNNEQVAILHKLVTRVGFLGRRKCIFENKYSFKITNQQLRRPLGSLLALCH